MIRFKHNELGYTVASRHFRNEADRCGRNVERQVTRIQNEYDLMCKRHADDPKFLIGVDKAFSEFMHRRNIPTFSEAEADAPQATGARPPAPALRRSATNSTSEAAPLPPHNLEIFEPRSGDAGDADSSYLQAEKGKERAEMLYSARR